MLFRSCGILVPWPGIEPMPPALGAWSLNHWTAREVPCRLFFFFESLVFIFIFIYLFIFINLFIIYFWLCWVIVAARGLSLVVASRGYSSSRYTGLLIAVASLVAEHGL